MADARKRRNAERTSDHVGDSIEWLWEFSPEVIRDLIRRGKETSEIDGYAANTGLSPVSRGARTMLVENEAGALEAVPVGSSTESAAFARGEDTRRDPLYEAIEKLFDILDDIHRAARKADKLRHVVLDAGDRRKGREPQAGSGDCLCCGEYATGVGNDRLKRGLDNKCWVSWSGYKLDHRSADPAHDFQQFLKWRKAEMKRLAKEQEAVNA